jgi:hypothetical protein
MRRRFVDLNRWRDKIRSWRLHEVRSSDFLSKAQIAPLWSRLSGLLLPLIQSFIGIFLWSFFKPFSILFWGALLVALFIFNLFIEKRYQAFILAVLVMTVAVTIISLRATYLVASGEHRFQYRLVDGQSYFEFPDDFPYLKEIVEEIAGHQAIKVKTCDNVKVAVLPSLPYQPLFLKDNLIDNLGFRRLPGIHLEQTELVIRPDVSVSGEPSNGNPHGSVGLEFGFSTGSDATTAITQVFPRTLKCQEHHVPLIPILETLPWNPDDVGALVQAVAKVGRLRDVIAGESVSFEQLQTLAAASSGETQYDHLFDFVMYSLMYRMFDGNIFSELRADIANAACRVADSHADAFSGPYAALPEVFTRRLLAELKSKIRQAAPACVVSDDLVRAYLAPDKTPPPIPFDQTFLRCLNSSEPMRQCLAGPDARIVNPSCEGALCGVPFPPPDEMILEDYDEKFYALVATKDNKLVGVDSQVPEGCPDLRDAQEDQHFVDWWIDDADKVTLEAAECSPSLLQRYKKSQTELHSALACAAKRGIHGGAYQDKGPYLVDTLFDMKCSGERNFNKEVLLIRLSEFFSQIDSIVSKLTIESKFTDTAYTRALIKALNDFRGIQQKLCGANEFKKCFEDYGVWQDYDRPLGAIASAFGLSHLERDAKAVIDALADNNNYQHRCL